MSQFGSFLQVDKGANIYPKKRNKNHLPLNPKTPCKNEFEALNNPPIFRGEYIYPLKMKEAPLVSHGVTMVGWPTKLPPSIQGATVHHHKSLHRWGERHQRPGWKRRHLWVGMHGIYIDCNDRYIIWIYLYIYMDIYGYIYGQVSCIIKKYHISKTTHIQKNVYFRYMFNLRTTCHGMLTKKKLVVRPMVNHNLPLHLRD